MLRVVNSISLPEADMNKKRKFKIKVQDERYDSNIALGKFLLNQGNLFVHGTYEKKGEKRSHLIWFDTKEEQSNGHINPKRSQSFEIDKTPITHLYLPYSLTDTAVFYNGKMYFLIEEQEKGRAVVFNPEEPDNYRILSKGVGGGDAILSLAAVNDDLIFGGDKNLYRLHKDRLKKICPTKCRPRFMRSLPDERIILYSNGEKDQTWCVELDSNADHSDVIEESYFEIHQANKIVLASILKERIQRAEYNGVHDFKNDNQENVDFSHSISGLKRIIMPNKEVILGIAQEEKDAKVYALDQRLKQGYKDAVILPNTSYLRVEVQNE
jgi:hypothetical protein